MSEWGQANLTQIADGQVPVYSAALGKLIPGSAGGALPLQIDYSIAATLTYGGFSFGADSWTLSFSSFSNLRGSVTPGKLGILSVQTYPGLTLTLSAPADFEMVDFNNGLVGGALSCKGSRQASGPLLLAGNGALDTCIGATLPVSTWSFGVYVSTASGVSLGSGALTYSGGLTIVAQTQIQP